MNSLLILYSFFLFISLDIVNQNDSNTLDCELIYLSCINRNPYNLNTQIYAHFGYINGCIASRGFCYEVVGSLSVY